MRAHDDGKLRSYLERMVRIIDAHESVQQSPTRGGIDEVISTVRRLYFAHNCKPGTVQTEWETSIGKAEYYMDLALQTFKQMERTEHDHEYKIKIMMAFGDTYNVLGNYEQALSSYKEALSLSEKLQNLRSKAEAKFKISKIHLEKGQWESAKILLEESGKDFENIKDYSGMIRVKIETGKIYYQKGNYTRAQALFQNALEIAEETDDLRSIAQIKNNLGIIHRMQRNREEAVSHFQDALAIFQSIQDFRGVAESFNNLGVVYLQGRNFRQAITSFEKSLRLCHQWGYFPLMAFVYLNKSDFYVEVGDYPMAAVHCGRALEILHRLGDPIGLAKVCRIYGKIFWKCGEIETGFDFYRESVDFYSKFEIPLGLANCHVELGAMYEELNRSDDAIKQYYIAGEIYGELGITKATDDLLEKIESLEIYFDQANSAKENRKGASTSTRD